MTYTEGWPRTIWDMNVGPDIDPPDVKVVPLSDAEILSDLLGDAEAENERLREERDELAWEVGEHKPGHRIWKARAERLRGDKNAAEDAIAVWREREQVLREALERIANDTTPDSNDTRWAQRIARAALTDKGERDG